MSDVPYEPPSDVYGPAQRDENIRSQVQDLVQRLYRSGRRGPYKVVAPKGWYDRFKNALADMPDVRVCAGDSMGWEVSWDNDAAVDHPTHYGGDTTYEAIKVIQAWGLGFEDGNAVKYICRQGKKANGSRLEDLRKAKRYLEFLIERLEREEDVRDVPVFIPPHPDPGDPTDF